MGSRKSTIASTKYSRSLDDKGREINDDSLMQRRLSESDSSASSLNSPLFANSSVSSGSSTTTIQPRALQVSLPSSWYTSENFFALETRAIFSQALPHLIREHRLHDSGMALRDAQQSIPRDGNVPSLPCRNIPNLFDTFQGRNHTWVPQHLPSSWLSRCC